MKYAHKIDFPNSAKEKIFVGAKMATYSDVFDFHKAMNRNEILSYLPEDLKNKSFGVHIANMNFDRGINELWAHKHLRDKCVLNIYFQTNDEETIFYEGDEVELLPKEGEPDFDTRSGSTKFSKKLSMDTLSRVESFIAKENECWLLKTTQPHSVLSHRNGGNRIVLQVYFHETEYEEVGEILEKHHVSN